MSATGRSLLLLTAGPCSRSFRKGGKVKDDVLDDLEETRSKLGYKTTIDSPIYYLLTDLQAVVRPTHVGGCMCIIIVHNLHNEGLGPKIKSPAG